VCLQNSIEDNPEHEQASDRTSPQIVAPVYQNAVNTRLHHPEGVLARDAWMEAGVHAEHGDASAARPVHPAASVVARELQAGVT
jgi:hypothetical protein